MNANKRDARGLDERLRSLPAEIPPGRDLWPEVAKRISTGADTRMMRRPGWHGWAAAAAMAGVALLIANLYRGGEQPPPDTGTAGIEPAVQYFGPAYPLNAGYQAARAGLAADLEQRLARLPDDARATVLENLEAIQRAMLEINRALGDDPSNPLLQHQLLATYHDELAVLANLKHATERMPDRNEI